MVLVIIRMQVIAEKRKELIQTIVSLIGSLRVEMGCRRCDFYRSMEDQNKLCVLQEWDTRENFDCHLMSERFKVLRGAMNLLQEPYEMLIHTEAAGTREKEARSQKEF
jgi:quinol monooxygenase YgiN